MKLKGWNFFKKTYDKSVFLSPAFLGNKKVLEVDRFCFVF